MIDGKTLSDYLQPTHYIDCDAPAVMELAKKLLGSVRAKSPQARAIVLFEGVRERIRYDPYNISLDPKDYRASQVAEQRAAYCIPKAILLTALARAADIPTLIGFADVSDHLISPKLRELMGTDLLVCQSYTAMWLGGRFVKVVPAFNAELCKRLAIKPLVFDGRRDAIIHQMKSKKGPQVEYFRDRGLFVEPPVEAILTELAANYPKLTRLANSQSGSAVRDSAFHGKVGHG